MGKLAPRYTAGRYAAIDIGTVTARLLVADVGDSGELDELIRDHAICNLGIGVDKTGRLDPAAIERVGAVVEGFVGKIDGLQREAGKPIAVTANATSASRDAENSRDFVDTLANLGVTLQVIPGEKEAALSFAGASSAFPGEKAVVLDVGGGSTEVIAGRAGASPLQARSFNIGCRRVTERCFHADPPTPDEIAGAAGWIAGEMREYLGKLGAEGFGACRVIAVAGTATSIVSMREKMAVYDSSRVHGATVTRACVDSLLGDLANMTLEERQNVVGLEPQRAPVIVAGLLILQQIMEVLGATALTISERDILHGIILDAAAS